MDEQLTKVELIAKLKAVKPKDSRQRNKIACSLIGHSKIRTFFFGYNYCGRCGAELGDSLGGAWKADGHFIEGHDDEECLEALKNMGWRDKLYVPTKIYNPTPTSKAKKQ